jgi:hypothetical protein
LMQPAAAARPIVTFSVSKTVGVANKGSSSVAGIETKPWLAVILYHRPGALFLVVSCGPVAAKS